MLFSEMGLKLCFRAAALFVSIQLLLQRTENCVLVDIMNALSDCLCILYGCSSCCYYTSTYTQL